MSKLLKRRSNEKRRAFKILQKSRGSGYDRLHNLDKLQRQSLNNQLNDLIEEHNYIVETVTDDEIIGRYELVTLHIYPSEFVQMARMIEEDKL